MTGILMALQAQPRTAQSLADRFEVSRRTILRDIEELVQLGVPIAARSGPSGGYAIPRTWWLAPLQLTDDEVRTLLFALDHLDPTADGPWHESHERLVEKLRAALTPGAFERARDDQAHPRVDADHRTPSSSTVRIIRQAIATDSWLMTRYRGGTRPGERRFKPQEMYVADNRWYVRTVDERSREIRHFRIDRMDDVRRCLGPETAADIIASAGNGRDYHAAEHPEIVVRLMPRGRQLAADHPDFRAHIDGDTIRFRCPPSELPFYGRELLRFGTEAEILGPPEMRTWIGDHLDALRRHHG